MDPGTSQSNLLWGIEKDLFVQGNGGLGPILHLFATLNPGCRKTSQIQVDPLQDHRILSQTVDEPIIALHHGCRNLQIFVVKGPIVREEEPNGHLFSAHKRPPVRLNSGMAARNAKTMMMAELTHHWHQA